MICFEALIQITAQPIDFLLSDPKDSSFPSFKKVFVFTISYLSRTLQSNGVSDEIHI